MTFRGKAPIAVALLALAIPAAAQAQTSIGQLAPPNPPAGCTHGPFEAIPGGAAAAGYRVPAAGAITSWSTSAAAGKGQSLTFKVYRPLGSERYVVVGHDGPRPLNEGAVNTFKAGIVVQAGDLIGINDGDSAAVPNACAFETASREDLVLLRKAGTADGTPFDVEGFEENGRLNLAATFQAVPAITTISPASGSAKGGTRIRISGTNFAEVKGVSFGIFPVSFTVDSEGQITASAPASAKPGQVPVVVTTVAGSATAPKKFSYEGCLVPRLRGKTLNAARGLLRKSGCRLGKVTRHYGETAKISKVIGQSPKPGKLLAPRAKVNLTVVDRPTDI